MLNVSIMMLWEERERCFFSVMSYSQRYALGFLFSLSLSLSLSLTHTHTLKLPLCPSLFQSLNRLSLPPRCNTLLDSNFSTLFLFFNRVMFKKKFCHIHKCSLLCILTSHWVLLMPFAGQNLFFLLKQLFAWFYVIFCVILY